MFIDRDSPHMEYANDKFILFNIDRNDRNSSSDLLYFVGKKNGRNFI